MSTKHIKINIIALLICAMSTVTNIYNWILCKYTFFLLVAIFGLFVGIGQAVLIWHDLRQIEKVLDEKE